MMMATINMTGDVPLEELLDEARQKWLPHRMRPDGKIALNPSPSSDEPYLTVFGFPGRSRRVNWVQCNSD